MEGHHDLTFLHASIFALDASLNGKIPEVEQTLPFP
jgi:hypothetical protein